MQSNQTTTRKKSRKLVLAIVLLLFLLFLLISLGLSTAGSQALFAGKLTADIPEDGKIPQTSLEELLRLDSNLDGVPDYQQPDLFTPDNEYDRRVVNALKWVNEHINELELPESAQPKPSQTEPSQPEPSQPEPSQPEPSQTEPSQTEPSQTEPSQPSPSVPSTGGAASSPSGSGENPGSSGENAGDNETTRPGASSGGASSGGSSSESSSSGGASSENSSSGWDDLPENVPGTPPYIRLIRVVTPPDKREYIEDECFDPTGLTVVMEIGPGNRTDPVTAFLYPTEPLPLGTEKVTLAMLVGRNRFETTVPVTVRKKVLLETSAGLAVTGRPYIEGQFAEIGHFSATGRYDNGLVYPLPVIRVPEDALALGQKTVAVTIQTEPEAAGRAIVAGSGTETIEVPVSVIRKSPAVLTVIRPPDKADYIAGQTFNPTGMAVEVAYDNGTERREVADYVLPSDELTAEQLTVAASYTENGAVVTAAIPISVRYEVLLGMELHRLPDKTVYIEETKFDPTGLELACRYDNGKTLIQSAAEFTDAEFALGDTEKNVSVTHRGVTMTLPVPVAVKKASPVSLTLADYPDALTQNAGMRLNLDGMELAVTYDSGKIKTVPATDARVALSNGKQQGELITPVIFQTNYPLADCSFTDNGVTVSGREEPASRVLRITPYLAEITLELSDSVPYYKVGDRVGPTGLIAAFTYRGAGAAVLRTPPCDPTRPADELVRLMNNGLLRLSYEEEIAQNDGAADKPLRVTLTPSPQFVLSGESHTEVKVAPLLPESAELVTPPDKAEYVNDEPFTSAGLALRVTMNNGSTRALTPDSEGVSIGYGECELTDGDAILKHRNEVNWVRYAYNGATVSVPLLLDIEDEIPVSLTRGGSVSGLSFIERTEFAPGAIVYEVTLSNGKTISVPYESQTVVNATPGRPTAAEGQGYRVMASPEPGDTLVTGNTKTEHGVVCGKNTAEFSFAMNGGTVSDSFDFIVEPRRVVSLTAVGKKTYDHNGVILPGDFGVTLRWDNGETSTADPANTTISTAKAVNTGLVQTTNRITLGVAGLLTIGAPTCMVDVTVKAPAPTKLEIATPPSKTQYVSGTAFSPAGLALRATYSNGATQSLAYNSSGVTFDRAAGSEILFGVTGFTVRYAYNGATVQVTQPVTVIRETPTALQIIAAPGKTAYIEANTLNLAGLQARITLTNGKTVTAAYNSAGISCSPAHGAALATGHTAVTMSYTLNGVTKQAATPISVVQRSISSVSVRTNPSAMTYDDGAAINKAGLTLNAYYDNGQSDVISNVGNMIISPSTAVNKTAANLSQGVTVTLTGLRVVGNPSTSFIVTVKPGWVTCPTCLGGGRVTCSRCGGSGRYSYTGTCSDCGGSGKKSVSCPTTKKGDHYSGPGTYCSYCGKTSTSGHTHYGVVTVMCYTCNGTGWKQVSCPKTETKHADCETTSTCATCGGKGQVISGKTLAIQSPPFLPEHQPIDASDSLVEIPKDEHENDRFIVIQVIGHKHELWESEINQLGCQECIDLYWSLKNGGSDAGAPPQEVTTGAAVQINIPNKAAR